MRLNGKVAIVTGGASGFGAGISRCFAAEGAKVVVADLNLEGAQATTLAIEGDGGTAVACQVDVTQAREVEAMVAGAVENFGQLDILVNNAGIGQRPTPLQDTSDGDYDALFDINVKSVFLGCQAVLPRFRAQGHGNIINTASGIALTPRPNLVIYGATKGAVVTFTKGLAMELAEEGIRVNALCPAVADTPMLREFMGGSETAEARERFTASVPMGRLITPQDVGLAALYLASDEAGMITGTCLPVDGGRCI